MPDDNQIAASFMVSHIFFLIVGFRMKMNGKHFYYMLTTASVVWFIVMTMILGNLFLKTPLHSSFNKKDFNQNINAWTPKEHINEDLLSQIHRVTVQTGSFQSLGRFVKESNEDDWKRDIGDNPETTTSSLRHTYNISAPGNIFSKHD